MKPYQKAMEDLEDALLEMLTRDRDRERAYARFSHTVTGIDPSKIRTIDYAEKARRQSEVTDALLQRLLTMYTDTPEDAPMTSTTARVSDWGSTYYGHRVYHLTLEEQERIRKGGTVVVKDCPDFAVAEIRGCFYVRKSSGG